ncbi:MAG: N-acetylmuramic acid 6-phosphate etherase [Verrucomicrobia bacterium]|nr:N-acetylmuramic acid 6-phosphate etherase [Verrucomicrobiota bacterium]
MSRHDVPHLKPSLLGIECGGTRTSAVFEDGATGKRSEWSGGPSNLRLLSDSQHLRHFRSIHNAFPPPDAIAIGMAGVRTNADIQRIRQLIHRVWPKVPCHVSHDLEPALAAAPTPARDGKTPRLTRVLILSGTGSCCLGRTPRGRSAKVGGWGHILGDKGSAYEIGIRALKAVVFYLDRDQEWSLLGRLLLRRLLLNEPNDLIEWVRSAPKEQVAALALEVFAAEAQGDRIAKDILDGAASSLSRDAISCARRLSKPGEQVQFVLAGGALLKQPRFAANVARRVRAGWKHAIITPLKQPSVLGALELARALRPQVSRRDGASKTKEDGAPAPAAASRDSAHAILPIATRVSPTEQRNPKSMTLDRMSVGKAIELFLAEDQALPRKILPHRRSIERTVGWIVNAFKRGGRLLYVGAGTSGRLGVLDASECPPTFRTPADQVQGIIAGGAGALWESVEGAEDDLDAGAHAICFRGVAARDVVVGIAASGRTRFVWGALTEAKRRKARTVLLCCNPHLRFQPGHKPDGVIAIDVGPEILTGSTRLKSGTATKLVLNILTTLAMVKSGKVASNLMIDLNPSNTKLRDRAARILKELTGAGDDDVRAALEQSGWRVKSAWRLLRRGAGH